jgi:hypothetical protein
MVIRLFKVTKFLFVCLNLNPEPETNIKINVILIVVVRLIMAANGLQIHRGRE